MATFTWLTAIAPDGGDFDDPHDWFNDTTGMQDDGVPGAGDTVFVNTSGTVTVRGETIGTLNAGGTISGDLNVTETIEGGTFVNGDVGIKDGTFRATFSGKSLVAGEIDAATLTAGKVEADLLGFVTINGGHITTARIARVGLGNPCTIEMHGGTLVDTGAMTLNDDAASVGVADGFVMTGGTVTIAGEATVDGGQPSGLEFTGIQVSSGKLAFKHDLSLAHNGALDVSGGVVDIGGNLLVSGASVIEDGGAIEVTGEIIIGDGSGAAAAANGAPAAARAVAKDILNGGPPQTYNGPVVVGDGATGILTVAAGAVVTANAGWVVGDLAHGPGKVTVTGAGSGVSGVARLTVGKDGSGTLLVDNGAKLSATSLVIAEDKAGRDTVTIDSGAMLSVKLTVDAGYDGAGTLTIKGGAALSAETVGIGVFSGSIGTINIAGRASLSADLLGVGDGRGSAGALVIGAEGTVKIKTLATFGAGGGSGSLTVAKGGLLAVGKELQVGAQGSIDLSAGGAITVGSGTAGHAGAVSIFGGGDVLLGGKSGSYRAETIIGQGLLEVEANGAAGTGDILFATGGGTIELTKGVALSNTIFGFGNSDTIDLVGTTANSATFSGGVLTVRHGKTTVATLDFSGNYTSANFSVTFDPADTTTTIGFVASGKSAGLADCRMFGPGGSEFGSGHGSGLGASHLLLEGALPHTILGFR